MCMYLHIEQMCELMRMVFMILRLLLLMFSLLLLFSVGVVDIVQYSNTQNVTKAMINATQTIHKDIVQYVYEMKCRKYAQCIESSMHKISKYLISKGLYNIYHHFIIVVNHLSSVSVFIIIFPFFFNSILFFLLPDLLHTVYWALIDSVCYIITIFRFSVAMRQ